MNRRKEEGSVEEDFRVSFKELVCRVCCVWHVRCETKGEGENVSSHERSAPCSASYYLVKKRTDDWKKERKSHNSL